MTTSDSTNNNTVALENLRKEAYIELKGQFWRLLLVYAALIPLYTYISMPAYVLSLVITALFTIYDALTTVHDVTTWRVITTYLYVTGIIYLYRWFGAYGLYGVVVASIVIAAVILFMRREKYMQTLRDLETVLFGSPLIQEDNDEVEGDAEEE